MGKQKAAIWIGIFLMVIVSPVFAWYFLGPYIDSENYEKRDKGPRPVFTLQNYEAFPREWEPYYNDNIPFRNQLIRLNNSIDYYLFGQSSSGQVAIGKDGWLFYCSDGDGNPLEQSLGYWHFTDGQLAAIAGNLMSSKRALESLGIEFVLFIAPNKESVYQEKLPDCYKAKNPVTSTDQLVQYLKENTDIRVVYPKQALLDAKQKYPDLVFYHKLDSHWNYAGGYVGANSLADELEVELPPLGEVTMTARGSLEKDLSDMLNVPIKDSGTDYDITGIQEWKRETRKWDFSSEFIYHTPGADPRRLFVCRDSYGTAVAPHLSTQFEDSIWVHCNQFNQQQVLGYGADIFVLEKVERHLNSLEGFCLSFSDDSGKSNR